MITVIFNRAAGPGRADRRTHLAELFREAGVLAEILSFEKTADAAGAARSAARAGRDAVVAAGGDGTVSIVASALVGSTEPLGVLPLGTLNHFARDAGIPVDLAEAVKTIAEGHTRRIDVGDVNGRTFVNNASLGFYPDIVVERESLRRQGYRKWPAFAVASARILRTYRGLAVKITAGDSTEITRTPFLFVGNNEYGTDGLHLGARSRLDAGRLYAYLAPRVHTRELPKLFAMALAGRARERHALESFAACELEAQTLDSRRQRVAIDGEVALMTAPLQFRIRAGALTVIVPGNR